MSIAGGAEIPGLSLRPDICNPDVVTVQVDMQNAFNPVNHSDMLHAVEDKLPSLLPYVLMAYQQRSPRARDPASRWHTRSTLERGRGASGQTYEAATLCADAPAHVVCGVGACGGGDRHRVP